MKTLIAALSLSLMSNLAQADGFAPWSGRALVPDAQTVPSAMTAPAGFAPWRDLLPRTAASDDAIDVGMRAGSAFRPWYMPS